MTKERMWHHPVWCQPLLICPNIQDPIMMCQAGSSLSSRGECVSPALWQHWPTSAMTSVSVIRSMGSFSLFLWVRPPRWMIWTLYLPGHTPLLALFDPKYAFSTTWPQPSVTQRWKDTRNFNLQGRTVWRSFKILKLHLFGLISLSGPPK